MHEVLKCGSCGERDLAPVLDLGDQPLAERESKRYPLKLVKCTRCMLVQLSYIVDENEMFPREHPYATGNTKALREHFAHLAYELHIDYLRKNHLIVDIGANDGTMLSCIPPGIRRIAVEPTDQILKVPQGIMRIQEFFTAKLADEILENHGLAEVITACNVLAHVPDPHDFLEGVKILLSDDGVFITENHDWASIANGLQIDTIYHEHLRYYSVASLSCLLASHGLLVSEAEKISTHGGSFRAYVTRERSHLGVRAHDARERLRHMLTYLDGPVYGVGACTRATPLIHYAGLEEFLTCVCEVPSSEKIGMNMPGTGIPVVDEGRLIRDQPPYALLFAWHWADTIVPKLRSAGYRGKFIIPLPKAEVYDG
jgi:hypothetical protein